MERKSEDCSLGMQGLTCSPAILLHMDSDIALQPFKGKGKSCRRVLTVCINVSQMVLP